jgi:carboxyl-terminal processing protease
MSTVERSALTLAIVLLCGCTETQKVKGFPDEFVGVGLELSVANSEVRVVRPIEGGPAATAGVLAGDLITAVNGESTAGMSLGQVVTLLRGRPDSQLTLSVERNGKKMMMVLRRTKMVKKGKDYKAK